jgi:hypothetical protein
LKQFTQNGLPSATCNLPSDKSEDSDMDSFFDTEDEDDNADGKTDPTDLDAHNEVGDDADLAWITGEENAHPPEYYLNQDADGGELDDEREHYSNNSLLLLDMIETLFYQ